MAAHGKVFVRTMRNRRFLLIDNARPDAVLGGLWMRCGMEREVWDGGDGAGGVGRWVLRNILMDTGGTEEGNGRMAQSQWRIERGKKRRDTRKGKPRMSRSVSVAVPRESSARRVGGNRRRRMDCPRITLSPLPSSGAGRRSGGWGMRSQPKGHGVRKGRRRQVRLPHGDGILA